MKVLIVLCCALALASAVRVSDESSSSTRLNPLFLQLKTRLPNEITIPKDPEPHCPRHDVVDLPEKDPPKDFHISQMYPECVLGLKAQGICGNCWAFSSSRILGTRLCMQRGGRSRLWFSTQQLARCVSSGRTNFCWEAGSDPSNIEAVVGFVPWVQWDYSVRSLFTSKGRPGGGDKCAHYKTFEGKSPSEKELNEQFQRNRFDSKSATLMQVSRIVAHDFQPSGEDKPRSGHLIHLGGMDVVPDKCKFTLRLAKLQDDRITHRTGRIFKVHYVSKKSVWTDTDVSDLRRPEKVDKPESDKEKGKDKDQQVDTGNRNIEIQNCGTAQYKFCMPTRNEEKIRNWVIKACSLTNILYPDKGDKDQIIKQVQHAIMTQGPVAISYDTSLDRKTGAYHSVAAEGWKTDKDGNVHWIVANSWGSILSTGSGQGALSKKLSKSDAPNSKGKDAAYLALHSKYVRDYNIGITPVFQNTYRIRKLHFTAGSDKKVDLKVSVTVPAFSSSAALFLTKRRQRFDFKDRQSLTTFIKENKKGDTSVAKVNVVVPKFSAPKPSQDSCEDADTYTTPTVEVDVDMKGLNLADGQYELRLQIADGVWIDRVDFDRKLDEFTHVLPQHPPKPTSKKSDKGKEVETSSSQSGSVSSVVIEEFDFAAEMKKLESVENLKNSIDNGLAEQGLKVHKVHGDGFCLYRALCEASRLHANADVRRKLKTATMFTNDNDDCRAGDAYKAACAKLKAIVGQQELTEAERTFHQEMCASSGAWDTPDAPVVENMPMLLDTELNKVQVRVGMLVPVGIGVKVLGLGDVAKCKEDAICLVYSYEGARHWDAVVPTA